ncbi:hypothetical protein C8F01DRAFT_926611, partial [Mycena amicta]
GRGWGVEWAMCVGKFFDFEGAWGFVDGSWGMPKTGRRPPQLSGWLAMGRKWTMPPTLVDAELWVGVWWVWWKSLQPAEREVDADGDLSQPATADWSSMVQMYGNGGFMLVMATLAWWGEVAQERGEEAIEEWSAAVRDVAWV